MADPIWARTGRETQQVLGDVVAHLINLAVKELISEISAEDRATLVDRTISLIEADDRVPLLPPYADETPFDLESYIGSRLLSLQPAESDPPEMADLQPIPPSAKAA